MSKSVDLPPPGFEDLTAEQQLDYLHALWERFSADPDRVPVPDWHLRIIRERLDEMRRNPDDGRPWSEVRADIERVIRDKGD